MKSSMSWLCQASNLWQTSTPVCFCCCVRSHSTRFVHTFIICKSLWMWRTAGWRPVSCCSSSESCVHLTRSIWTLHCGCCTLYYHMTGAYAFLCSFPCHCQSSIVRWIKCHMHVLSLHKLHITNDEYLMVLDLLSTWSTRSISAHDNYLPLYDCCLCT